MQKIPLFDFSRHSQSFLRYAKIIGGWDVENFSCSTSPLKILYKKIFVRGGMAIWNPPRDYSPREYFSIKFEVEIPEYEKILRIQCVYNFHLAKKLWEAK
jgi:hypothetical protein